MLIGYARVSTQDQNLELQREALSKAGCKKVFEDKVSGTRADRPGLAKTLEMLREGDTWSSGSTGWAGRSSNWSIWSAICTSTVSSSEPHRLHRHRHTIRAVLLPRHGEPCQMERELTVERTRAGLEVAKQLGRKGGRKPKMTDSKIESAKKLLASGCRPRTWPRTSACPFRRCTAGCQPPRTLSVLYFPFSGDDLLGNWHF
jgi:hypothetical protein